MKDQSATMPDGFKADRLPVLPHVLLRIIRACHTPALNYQQLAEVINQDATIAARVVSASNAAFYGQPGRIGSVERALMVLGTETLKTIVITLAVQQVFDKFSRIPAAFLQEFWHRSLSCALLAKSVATLTSYAHPDEAYFAGLLHNLGELVLAVQFGASFYELRERSQSDQEQVTLEQSLLGIDHPTAGAGLAQHWRLDTYLVDALRYHHRPTEQVLDAQHLTKLVHLASMLASQDEPQRDQLLAADLLFGLMPPLVSEICKRIEGEVEALAKNLDIHLEDGVRLRSKELANELKIISLLQTARGHLLSAATDQEALTRVRQAAEMLFQTSHSLLFMVDHTKRAVVCHPTPQDPALELRILLQPGRSLITDALMQQEITTWWPAQTRDQAQDQNLSQIIDKQVLAILQTAGLACLPLQHNKNILGVLVLGLHHPINPGQRHMMMLFGAEAAQACAPQTPITTATAPDSGAAGDDLQQTIRETVHEANNPLSIIRNYLEVLARKLDREHEAQQDLEVIREEVDRTARLLLNLSQSAQPRVAGGAIQINSLATQMVQLFRNSIFATKSIDCHIDCDPALPEIQTDETALRQVLTNLLKNAAEALAPGGQIRLSTRDRINLNGKAYIEIRVGDNGPGLPLDVQEHLYQPGHSTKGEGHAGLGLSIVRNLMSGLGGLVSCHTASTGTEFQLLVPRILVDAVHSSSSKKG